MKKLFFQHYDTTSPHFIFRENKLESSKNEDVKAFEYGREKSQTQNEARQRLAELQSGLDKADNIRVKTRNGKIVKIVAKGGEIDGLHRKKEVIKTKDRRNEDDKFKYKVTTEEGDWLKIKKNQQKDKMKGDWEFGDENTNENTKQYDMDYPDECIGCKEKTIIYDPVKHNPYIPPENEDKEDEDKDKDEDKEEEKTLFNAIPWDTKIDMGDMPPDIFGEFAKLNPNSHWVEYKDLYNYMQGLPEQKRMIMEDKISLYVAGEVQENIQTQLDTLRKDPSVPTDQRSFFDAQWKITQGDKKNITEAVTQLTALIANPSTTADVKAMAQDVLNKVQESLLDENKQALAYRDLNGLWMFRTHLGVKIDDINDDWWITNQFEKITGTETEEQKEQKLSNEFLKTLDAVENLLQTGPAKNIDEALTAAVAASTITATQKIEFKKAYDKYISTEMAGTVMAKPDNQINPQEIKEMPDAWLKMADKLREEGKIGQAKEIYERLFWSKLVDKGGSKTLSAEEEKDIEEDVSLDEIKEDLKKRGMLDGMSASDITTLVTETYNQTVAGMKEAASMKKSIDGVNPEKLFGKGSMEFKAMNSYQDMLGMGEGWDWSDETWQFLKEELIINAALILVSGGVGTIARIGAQSAVRGIARGAARTGVRGFMGRGAARLGTFGAKGIEVGRFGKITRGGVGLAAMEGAVFHETEHLLVHGELWSDDHARGMLMSAMMFNLFRGGNALYEGIASKTSGRLGTFMQQNSHMNDFLKSSANGNRLSTLGNSVGNRLMRVSGEAVPFHVINGTVTGITSGEWDALTSGGEMGKNWTTLMMLSLLPKGRGGKIETKNIETKSPTKEMPTFKFPEYKGENQKQLIQPNYTPDIYRNGNTDLVKVEQIINITGKPSNKYKSKVDIEDAVIIENTKSLGEGQKLPKFKDLLPKEEQKFNIPKIEMKAIGEGSKYEIVHVPKIEMKAISLTKNTKNPNYEIQKKRGGGDRRTDVHEQNVKDQRNEKNRIEKENIQKRETEGSPDILQNTTQLFETIGNKALVEHNGKMKNFEITEITRDNTGKITSVRAKGLAPGNPNMVQKFTQFKIENGVLIMTPRGSEPIKITKIENVSKNETAIDNIAKIESKPLNQIQKGDKVMVEVNGKLVEMKIDWISTNKKIIRIQEADNKPRILQTNLDTNGNIVINNQKIELFTEPQGKNLAMKIVSIG